MAREGIDDVAEGIGEFLHQAKVFHETRPNNNDSKKVYGIEAYIDKKVKSKNRRFNSVNNRAKNFTDLHEINSKASEYRNQSDGDL